VFSIHGRQANNIDACFLGQYLYGIDGTTHRPTALACVDFNTGERKWSQPNFGSGALMAADNQLIILDKDELIIADATPEKSPSAPAPRSSVANAGPSRAVQRPHLLPQRGGRLGVRAVTQCDIQRVAGWAPGLTTAGVPLGRVV
jgi:hypothetical protein